MSGIDTNIAQPIDLGAPDPHGKEVYGVIFFCLERQRIDLV
jgi:hypothetical protein